MRGNREAAVVFFLAASCEIPPGIAGFHLSGRRGRMREVECGGCFQFRVGDMHQIRQPLLPILSSEAQVSPQSETCSRIIRTLGERLTGGFDLCFFDTTTAQRLTRIIDATDQIPIFCSAGNRGSHTQQRAGRIEVVTYQDYLRSG
jgi:hypothetical protein